MSLSHSGQLCQDGGGAPHSVPQCSWGGSAGSFLPKTGRAKQPRLLWPHLLPPATLSLKSWGLGSVHSRPLPALSSPAWGWGGGTEDPGPGCPFGPSLFPCSRPSPGGVGGAACLQTQRLLCLYILSPKGNGRPHPAPPSPELCITWNLYLCIRDVICTKGSS